MNFFFEYDFLFLVNDNIFADMKYWDMIYNIIDDNANNARHFKAMLLTNVLPVSVADEEVTYVGLAMSA